MTQHHGDRPTLARRFYAACHAEAQGQGFAVKLDGRTPKSPSGTPLVLPTKALADLCAAEWEAQGENIDPATLHATRLAFAHPVTGEPLAFDSPLPPDLQSVLDGLGG